MSGKYTLLAVVLLVALAVPVPALADETARVVETPVRWEPSRAGLVITRVETEGEVTTQPAKGALGQPPAPLLARMRMKIEAESYQDGEQRILLFGEDVAVTDWSVKKPMFGADAHIRRTEDGLEFVVDGDGRYTLTLEFVLRVSKERLGHKVSLPIVRGLATETRLTVPSRELEFKAEPEVSMETAQRGDATTVTIYGGAGTIALTWTPKAPEKVLKPVIFADQTIAVRIGQGVMRLDSAIDFSIVQGNMRDFEIRFPVDCSLLNIEGKDIRTWDIAEPESADAPRTLKVALLGDVEKEYRLTLRLEKVLPEIKMDVDLPVIEPLDVIREKGQVAVSAAKGISVEAVALDGISHVDVREMARLPQTQTPGEEVRLGFRYLKRPFGLTIRTGEVVAKTSVEVLTLVRAGMDSMRLTSNLNYTIRDAGVFQFRVRLDEGLKLVDIKGPNINNWQLDATGRVLTVALRSKAEGQYALRIETELEKPGADGALVPTLRALDVDRESGYVAVVPAPGIKVETAAVTGISQIDVNELPGELLNQPVAPEARGIADCGLQIADFGLATPQSEIRNPKSVAGRRASRPPTLAYRYIRPDYRVALNVSEIQPEVLAEVRTIATLLENELKLDTAIHYTIRRAGIFQLRVAIPRDLRRTNIEGDDIDDTSWDESGSTGGSLLDADTRPNGGLHDEGTHAGRRASRPGLLTVNLRSKVTGSYVLKIQTERTIEGLDAGVDLPVLSAVDVKKESGFLAVVTEAGFRVKPAESTELDDVSLSDLPPEMLKKAPKVALAFKYFSQPWTLALAVERIEPRVTAEVFNLLSIGEKLMTVSATVKCNILHAGVDTFAVKLPPGVTAVDIDGDSIKQREENKETGVWTITLQSKRTDSYTLYVSFQQKIAEDQGAIPYGGVQAQDVQRETGYLAVTSRPDVELTVADADIENLSPIDSREIPQDYLEGITLPVLLAYRYVSHPYDIRIGALPHDAAEVTVAVVEGARFSTTVTEEGNMITDMVCMLRNSRRQHLDLELPEGARVWHAFVAGQSVTPSQDGLITKIPVARPSTPLRAGAPGENNAFEVRLRFSDDRKELGRLGSMELVSPMRGIDIMRLGWTLSLPKGYDIVRDTGNIRRLDGFHIMEKQLRDLNPDQEVRAIVARRPAVSSKVSRQAIFNYAANERIGIGAQGESGRSRSIYTGVRPMQSNVFVFQALIVSADEPKPAWVKVHYVKGSMGIPMQGVVVVLAALGAGLVWRGRRYRRIARVGILFGCAVVALAVRTLAEGSYRDYLTTIIVTLIVVGVAAFIHTVFTGLREAWRRRRGGKAKSEAAPVPEPAAEPISELETPPEEGRG